MAAQYAHPDQTKVNGTDKHVCEECINRVTRGCTSACVWNAVMWGARFVKTISMPPHFHRSKHLLVRSVEPGEERVWCCVDEVAPGELHDGHFVAIQGRGEVVYVKAKDGCGMPTQAEILSEIARRTRRRPGFRFPSVFWNRFLLYLAARGHDSSVFVEVQGMDALIFGDAEGRLPHMVAASLWGLPGAHSSRRELAARHLSERRLAIGENGLLLDARRVSSGV